MDAAVNINDQKRHGRQFLRWGFQANTWYAATGASGFNRSYVTILSVTLCVAPLKNKIPLIDHHNINVWMMITFDCNNVAKWGKSWDMVLSDTKEDNHSTRLSRLYIV